MKDLLMSISKNKANISAEKVEISRPKRVKKRREDGIRQENTSEIGGVPRDSMREAVKNVASLFEGDAKAAESELLTALRSRATSTSNLKDIVSGMKIDKNKERDGAETGLPGAAKRPGHRRENIPAKFNKSIQGAPIDLFGSPPLGIFGGESALRSESDSTSRLSVWEAAEERQRLMSFSKAPKNYFDELIRWTEQGKLWTFPVDNEIGLEEEKQYSFADHIFLEKHLEPWCPKRGPIKNFMELVCVGLSKNPHVSVERKKAHIYWFKEYFEKKKDILKSVGAM